MSEEQDHEQGEGNGEDEAFDPSVAGAIRQLAQAVDRQGAAIAESILNASHGPQSPNGEWDSPLQRLADAAEDIADAMNGRDPGDEDDESDDDD